MDPHEPPQREQPIRAPLPIERPGQPQDKQEAKEQLKQAIGGSHEVLAVARTVFPFTLFPDTITIDRAKMSVAHRSFFRVAEVMSIRIEDILHITANVGPFFGSLKIAIRYMGADKTSDASSYEVNYLWREDALRIKRIMQGYIIATKRGIDCSALSTSELAHLLNQLGEGAPDEGS